MFCQYVSIFVITIIRTIQYITNSIFLFQELMLAAEWAKLNNIPFPDIDPTVVDREGFKECYVFENPDDPNCPIVMHFILFNKEFRNFKSPGKV